MISGSTMMFSAIRGQLSIHNNLKILSSKRCLSEPTVDKVMPVLINFVPGISRKWAMGKAVLNKCRLRPFQRFRSRC